MGSNEMHATALQVLFNIVLFALIYSFYRGAKNKPYKIPRDAHILGTVLIFTFNILSYWGADWFHVYSSFPDMKSGVQGHFEGVYIWLATTIGSNYYIFRIIIWGIGQLLLYATFKRTTVNYYLQLYMFIIFGLLWFSYARVSLAMAMMFYGVSVLYKPLRSKIISYIYGLSFIVASFFFHKSAIFGIGIIAISIISRFLNRRLLVVLILIMALIACFVVATLLNNFVDMDEDTLDAVQQSTSSAQGYLNDELASGSRVSSILRYVEHFIYISTAYLSIKLHLSNKYQDIPLVITIFMKIIIFIVVFSLPLMFTDFNTAVIMVRFLRFGFIPTSIIMAYLWQNRLFNGWTKTIMRLGLFMSVVSLLYSFYCS